MIPKESINADLVRRLITAQFPDWKDLPIKPVALSGWDNRTFHLGNELLVRMPSAKEYEGQVEKEHLWLPKLAPFLPLSIPQPLALGMPGEGYPWKWSIYHWLKGEAASTAPIKNLVEFAITLGQFLRALHRIDTKGAPLPGFHSFYRGGSLTHYDTETKKALKVLKGKIDTVAASKIWEEALATTWSHPPVWIHGDISPGNLLVQKGKLSAVIDFGQMAVGDPACDLAIAWTFFKDKSRKAFYDALPLNAGTWMRGRAWTLWKALITLAGFTNPNNFESERSQQIIEELIDYS